MTDSAESNNPNPPKATNWRDNLLDRHTPTVWAGIDCGDGWRPLVEAFYLLANRNPCMQIDQVKEKYGTLRLYFGHDDEKCVSTYKSQRHFERLLSRADGIELASSFTCESCGAYGTVRNGGWIRTLCDACADPATITRDANSDHTGSNDS